LAWAREMEIRAERSDLPLDTKILNRITLSDMVLRYRDTISIKKRGYEVERAVLTAFLRHRICCKPLSRVTAEDFATYRDERLQTIKPSTLRRQFTPLQNMFEIARIEWNLPIRENPISKLRVASSDQRRERRLKDGELENLTNAAHHFRNRLILPIVLFAIETGMRRSEILRLTWNDVVPEKRLAVLLQAKNGHPRTIPLSTRALSVLQTVQKTEERIFPMSANAFRLAWERLRARAGLCDLRFHDLRHEAISRFFEMGLNVPEVALISGHRDPRMLFRYTHPLTKTILKKLS
jgi:integrase